MTPTPASSRSRGRAPLVPPLAEHAADQTALLGGLLVTLIALCLIAIVLMALYEPLGASPLSLGVAVGAGLLYGAAYLLNRLGRYTAAALLAVSITAGALWVAMLSMTPSPDSNAIIVPYAVLPTLLASMLLPLWPTLGFAAGSLVVVLIHPAFRAGASPTLSFNTILYLFIVTVLVAVMTRLRERRTQEIARRSRALAESVAQFQNAFELTAIGMALVSPDGHCLRANPSLCALLGYAERELQTLTVQRITHPDDWEADLAQGRRLLAGELETYQLDKRYLHKEGRIIWATLSVSLVRSADGAPLHFIAQIQDITERKQTEQALQAVNERMAGWVSQLETHSREIGLLNELSNLLQSCFSAQEAYGILRQMGGQLFPHQAGALGVTNASRNLVEMVVAWGDAALATGAAAFAPDDCWALRRGRLHWYEAGAGAVRCPHLGGAEPPSCLCLPMMAHGETLGVLHLRAAPEGPPLSEARRGFAQTVADSVSLALANLKLRERLRDQSIRDALTGLFNRRYLEETLSRELSRAERDHLPVGVLMFDIDHFKRFNDTYGHAAGDEVLRALGRLLSRHVRVEDIPCRYGGEEFTLVLPGCGLAAAQERAEEIRQETHALQVTHAGQALRGLTVSIGVAALPDHGRTETELLRAADAALYRAKQSGRDRVCVAAPPARLPTESKNPPASSTIGV